jgi:hypothetical protein
MFGDTADVCFELAFESPVLLEEVLRAFDMLVDCRNKRVARQLATKQVCNNSSLGIQLVCVGSFTKTSDVLDLWVQLDLAISAWGQVGPFVPLQLEFFEFIAKPYRVIVGKPGRGCQMRIVGRGERKKKEGKRKKKEEERRGKKSGGLSHIPTVVLGVIMWRHRSVHGEDEGGQTEQNRCCGCDW